MKIEHRNSGNLSRLRGASGGLSAGKTSGRAQVSPPRNDQIEISTASAYLAAAQTMSDSYASKVSELSDAVSAGSYEVVAWAVSDGMIREHLQAA